MIIDCDSCTVRGAACTDCVVTFLTIPVGPVRRPEPPAGEASRTCRTALQAGPDGPHPLDRPVDLDDDERAAIDVLAASGLVPPLRMVRAM